jgi:hypothetical protein
MEVNCPQCGAPAPALTETRFYRCTYCASSFTIQGGTGLLQYSFSHERDDRLAWSLLGLFLEGSRVKASVKEISADFTFFPYWSVVMEDGEKRLIPAMGHEFDEIKRVSLPGGDLQFLPEGCDYPSPTISLQEAVRALPSGKVSTGRSLVYIPLYFLVYECEGTIFHSVISPIEQKTYAFATPAGQEDTISVKHILMMGFFTACILAEGFLLKNYLWRVGAVALTFGFFYSVYYTLLKKEL